MLVLCMLIFYFFLILSIISFSFFFFFNDTATTEIYTLSLHDALPISSGPWPLSRSPCSSAISRAPRPTMRRASSRVRSEEHTSELQSQSNLVCRLLLEKKKKNRNNICRHKRRRHVNCVDEAVCSRDQH